MPRIRIVWIAWLTIKYMQSVSRVSCLAEEKGSRHRMLPATLSCSQSDGSPVPWRSSSSRQQKRVWCVCVCTVLYVILEFQASGGESPKQMGLSRSRQDETVETRAFSKVTRRRLFAGCKSHHKSGYGSAVVLLLRICAAVQHARIAATALPDMPNTVVSVETAIHRQQIQYTDGRTARPCRTRLAKSYSTGPSPLSGVTRSFLPRKPHIARCLAFSMLGRHHQLFLQLSPPHSLMFAWAMIRSV